MCARCANDVKHKLNGESDTKSINHYHKRRHASSKFILMEYFICIYLIFNSQLFECRCGNRTVTKAYHVCCKECAKREKVCAKCLTSADKVNIEPPEKTPEEQLQLKVEMERLIKSLPERKRRTFLRYMNKGKEIDGENVEEQNSKKEGN